MRYTDENGYKRGKLNHSDLIHRQIAYKEIYLKDRESYPLRFSEYVIHHKDGNKKNNKISNLQILTPEEHESIHGFDYNGESFSGAEFTFLDLLKFSGTIILVLIILNLFIEIPIYYNILIGIMGIIIPVFRWLRIIT